MRLQDGKASKRFVLIPFGLSEARYHANLSRPEPSPGQLVELPILAEIIRVVMPHDGETPQLSQSTGSAVGVTVP
jgi:hypothetical protein